MATSLINFEAILRELDDFLDSTEIVDSAMEFDLTTPETSFVGYKLTEDQRIGVLVLYNRHKLTIEIACGFPCDPLDSLFSSCDEFHALAMLHVLRLNLDNTITMHKQNC